ncbi:myrosinase 1-like [Anticarsia gemmatalis]|uniref:myrosinase 1-like n=1 Tax=Anticarsia gemmatalis TaxID=129554 RepID=UPI003F7771B3
MNYVSVVVSGILISGCWCSVSNEVKFPTWFKFGAATSAYQIEGGWNASDKGVSIWDTNVHIRPDTMVNAATGDVACDSYHLWRRDIEMAEELGLDVYRFSISWTRLLPNGFANYISEDGKRYYNNLIDGLLEKGIEPVVTLYHADLPQILQDLGGWANPLIADWFSDYARIAFTLFGDRVKTWLTLNEAFIICDCGYEKCQTPLINDTLVGKRLCNKNTLIAHAKAWRMYDEEFKPKYNGKVSITSLFLWFEPATPEDKEVTDLLIDYWESRYTYPIYSKEGGWPPVLEKFLADKGKHDDSASILPFTAEEIQFIRGTYDFYALNHYTTRMIRKAQPGEKIGPWPLYGSELLGVQFLSDPTWEHAGADWFAIYPEGLRKQLHWLNQTYGVNEIMITENGYLDLDKHLDDWARLKYLKDHMEQVQLAISDGLNVTGYISWALMDNLEWFGGYSASFGLYSVDFSDPNRTRTPRQSARYYSRVTRTRSLHHTLDGLNYLK